MSTVIILNGPPGVGKDTIGRALAKEMPHVQLFEFKEAIRWATWRYFVDGHPRRERMLPFHKFKENANDRVMKEKRCVELSGRSPREAMIYVSEKVYKTIFGDDYFGVQAALNVEERLAPGEVAVFTDGGFPAEQQVLADRGHLVHVVRLHRDGFDFTGDSRDYVEWEPSIDVYLEEGNVQFAVDEIRQSL